MYEAFYYEDYETPPAYRWIGEVEGESPEQALLQNLPQLIASARDLYGLSPEDFDDESIQDSIFVFRPDAVVSIHDAARKSHSGS
ncbi:MAG TPA: hypothetical protein VFB21_12860 [Chthonomonadaceae bacterium]|nr:hypothetical protein [Chthonomonadaceae bacterium]